MTETKLVTLVDGTPAWLDDVSDETPVLVSAGALRALLAARRVQADDEPGPAASIHGIRHNARDGEELGAIGELVAADGEAGSDTGHDAATSLLHLLGHALRSVREGVCITDMRDRILFCNDALGEMYSYDPQELIGRNISILRSPDNPTSLIQEIWPATLRSGWQGELLSLRKDGSEFPIFLSTSTVHDEIGAPIAMISVATDITDRRRQAEALRSAQREAERANRLKSEFLANMSHEIRTPVNIVLGCTDLIEEHLEPAQREEFRNFFSSIAQSGRRLLDTIQKIIDISRFHISDFPILIEDVNLTAIVQECVRPLEVLATARGLSLNVTCPDADVVIRGDTYAITHALINVIENAIKYTEQGGVAITLRDDGLLTEVEVRDSGIGISSEFLPFIFDEFSQEKGGYGRPYEGTGLGLALTNKFIESCGGTISVESEKGKGSTFTFRFPCGAGDHPHNIPAIDSALAPLLRKAPGGQVVHVLLVEDDTATEQFIRIILAGTCTVHAAHTVNEARDILRDTSIDCVIVDTNLPGATGLQFAGSLRATDRWHDMPMIGLSGDLDDSQRPLAIQAGFDAFVSRPFRIAAFIDLVQRIAREPQSLRSARKTPPPSSAGT